jgi:4-diphosphocytidyl-2-C-methyl-D-erythritol kinase
MQLRKRIPMGAGLGGGSSDAAAVLLALPVLTGRPLPLAELGELGQQLGSDVPFFLLGGRAVGIGRGSELFPLPDSPAARGLLLAPQLHVNTAQAYRDLSPRLTTESSQNKIFSFQSHTWELGGWAPAENDFEAVVFEQHRPLAALKKRLIQAGASPAMMTGSGSALFGLFRNSAEVSRAIQLVKHSAEDVQSFPITLVSRARYRSQWWRSLDEHLNRRLWPPQSRYAR